MRRASPVVTKPYDGAPRPTGLRITQFPLLMRLRDAGAVTINRLAEIAYSGRAALTRNLRLMENRGLIRITPAQDRRMRQVELTSKGGRAVARAMPFWEEARQHMRGGLGEPRYKRLLADLGGAIHLAQD